MDLIRNTIEGLLYDFPIELMGNYITKDDSIDINEILIDIIKRKDVSFTQTVSDCSTTSCVFDFLLRCTPL